MKQAYAYLRACSLIFLLINQTMYGITIGSNTTMSLESYIEFPAYDVDNEIIGFAVMQEGFALEDETTTCTFSSVFPVAGPIVLNGGTLYLDRDLHIDNVTTLTSMGNIYGNGHMLELAVSMTELGAVNQNNLFVLDDLQLVVRSDVKLEAALCFQGECVLDGRGNTLDLVSTGSIAVAENSHLIIRDINLKGVSGDQIRCLDDTGVITLQDVSWQQNVDEVYTFSHGAFRFEDEVRMSGLGTFAYQSAKTSTLLSNSSLFIANGMTFSYDPIVVADQNLLELTDHSSLIELFISAWHVTDTGMQLKRGRFRVLTESYVSAGNGTLTFGDGASLLNDTILEIISGSEMKFLSGTLAYNNVGATGFSMGNKQAVLNMAANTRLDVLQNLAMTPGRLFLGNNATIARASGKTLTGSIAPQGSYTNIVF